MKPTLLSLYAKIDALGWSVRVVVYGEGKFFAVQVYQPRGYADDDLEHTLIVDPGDDEQFRGALQSLLRSISGSSLRL